MGIENPPDIIDPIKPGLDQIIEHYPKRRSMGEGGMTDQSNTNRAISAPRIPPMQGGSSEWYGQNAPQGNSQFTPPPSAGLGIDKARKTRYR